MSVRQVHKNKSTNVNVKSVAKTPKIIMSDLDDSECESIDIENLCNSPNTEVNTEVNIESSSDSEPQLVPSKVQTKSNKKVSQKDNIKNSEQYVPIKKEKKNTKKIIKIRPIKQNVKNNKRVELYLDDDPAKPITAGGVMIYKYVQSKMMLLIIDVDGKYEDIGGKIDPEDDDIFCAVARETQEETNNQIMSEDIIDRLKTAPYVYVPKSKYVIYMVEAIDDERKLKKADFGDMEEHDGFPRTIGWIARDVLMKPHNIKYKMNWRLKSKQLFDQLIEIEKNVKYKKKIFKTKSKKENTSDDNDSEETYTP